MHSIITGYYQPYTIASCDYDTIYSLEDQNPVAFPISLGSTLQMLNTSDFNDSILSTHAFIYPDITKSQILNTPGSPGDYRLRWVELPDDPFNGTAIGAVVLLSRSLENMCSLGAGWGTSKLNMSTFEGGPQNVLSEVGSSPGDLDRVCTVQFCGVTKDTDIISQEYFFLPVFLRAWLP